MGTIIVIGSIVPPPAVQQGEGANGRLRHRRRRGKREEREGEGRGAMRTLLQARSRRATSLNVISGHGKRRKEVQRRRRARERSNERTNLDEIGTIKAREAGGGMLARALHHYRVGSVMVNSKLIKSIRGSEKRL